VVDVAVVERVGPELAAGVEQASTDVVSSRRRTTPGL
jgi:hypothetical protein